MPMMDTNMLEESIDTDTSTQEVLLAASSHNIEELCRLFDTSNATANVRDEDTLTTPLHAAVSSCEPEHADENDSRSIKVANAAISDGEEAAVKTLQCLFENGAIWNDLDINDETPGCIALRLGLKSAYAAIVDAGVRAELLLHRLDAFQLLSAGAEDDDDDDDFASDNDMAVETNGAGETNTDESSDASAIPVTQNPDVESAQYLASELRFDGDRLLDADKNGVMMAWESTIMQASANALVSRPGMRILNVGHGMAIIDDMFQQKSPLRHDIIEAHPAVLENMRRGGWYDKQGVNVHAGRWQDIVGDLKAQGVVYDAIYFDTFAEDYSELKTFFSDHVPKLLDRQHGRFGLFNGLGADRQISQDVYKQVLEIDLLDAGLETEWRDMKVPDLNVNKEWDGVRKSYWVLDTYSMPTCTFSKQEEPRS